ncbi:MAG: CHAP domain-containing protein [Alphaproteobacteria bacterium]|nr:CHAP domain-containing protein [Alphaproteobacteria bacterium]
MRTVLSIVGCLALLTGYVAWRAMPEGDGRADPAPEAPASTKIAQTPDADTTIRLHDASLRIASAARAALDRPPAGFRRDCSGYVAGALKEAGVLASAAVPDDARVIDFWTAAEAEGRVHHNPIPMVGDLAFFDNTHDRDGNGKMDDQRTHIAIVVDVEPDGTVVLAHKGSKYALIRMNLLHPTERESPDGVEWNSWLRRSGDRGNPLGMYKTAELWAGFASLAP